MSTNQNLLGVLNGAAQTGYNVAPPMGVPGQQTFIANPVTINGYPVESDEIACGCGVARGTAITQEQHVYGNVNSPYGVKAIGSGMAAADFLGILVWDQGAHRSLAGGEACKRKCDMAGVMREGHVMVRLYQDTEADAPVFMVVNAANPLNAKPGEFVSGALGGAAVELANVFWWAEYKAAATPVGVVVVRAGHAAPAVEDEG